MAPAIYTAYNGPMVTTAGPTKVATGTSIKTMMQLCAPAAVPLYIVEWGISFDGSAAATPGLVELVDTGTIGATGTAYVTADIQALTAPGITGGGAAIQLSTTKSMYTSGGTEGSITVTRSLDTQLIAPTGQYVKQFPLDREPQIVGGDIVRIRCTFGTTVNAICYIQFATA